MKVSIIYDNESGRFGLVCSDPGFARDLLSIGPEIALDYAKHFSDGQSEIRLTFPLRRFNRVVGAAVMQDN